MTQPAASLVRATRAANRSMADRNTPFIFEEWYVVAFANEIDRSLRKRRILDRNLVLFRTQAGKPIALEDRCAHRSYPLSASKLDGDTIVCGYHGLRYDAHGDCIEVPSQAHCPKGIGVADFPLVERGPLVWIWMGARERADERSIPDLPWLESPHWERSQGYFDLPASYISLHENLLDLTHLSFLHAASFGTPDYATSPYETQLGETRFRLTRRVVPTRLPPVWADSTGITTNTAARIVTSDFLSPGMHVVSAEFYETAVAESERRVYAIRTAHIPTPQTATSTHYFIVHGRDYALGDPTVTQRMHEQLFVAFAEDVAGLSALEANLQGSEAEPCEISVASDRAAVEMRRYLKRRADEEQGIAERPSLQNGR